MSVACPYAGLMFIKHGISDNRHKTNGGEFFGLKNTQSYFVIRSTSNKASQFTICCSNFEKKKNQNSFKVVFVHNITILFMLFN